MRYGSLRLVHRSLLQCGGGMQDSVPADGADGRIRRCLQDVAWMRQTSEAHLAMLSRSELGHLRSDQQRYSLATPAQEEWRLARHLFVNSWWLDQISRPGDTHDLQDHGPHADDDTGVAGSDQIGPSIGELVDCDPDSISAKIRQLHERHYPPQSPAKLPGAVALALIDGGSPSGRRVLPTALVPVAGELEPGCRHRWTPGRLLQWFTAQVHARIRPDSLPPVERRCIFSRPPTVLAGRGEDGRHSSPA
jgi:hypothetical protein